MVLTLMRMIPDDVHMEAHGKTQNISPFFRAFPVFPWLFIMIGPQVRAIHLLDCPVQNTECSIRLGDGRRLGYAEYGDPQGRPLFYCHGFPASRLEAALLDSAARRRGVRVIAADRPGSGLSDFQPGRRIRDWPNDVIELADALGINRFAMVGVSGGGPYALACARYIPQRLTAVGVVCGLGQVGEPWALREMLWNRRLAFVLARRFPSLLKLFYAVFFGPLLKRQPDAILSMIARTPSTADRQVLVRADVGRVLLASIRESVRTGPCGILHELPLYTHPWGFRPEEINIVVELWHGEADPIVPVAHTRALLKRLAHAHSVILPGEGHFSLPINHMDGILRALAR
jgi:pimeloyl-ACP methyl ester carboxylesterase